MLRMKVWTVVMAAALASGCATGAPLESASGTYLALGDSVAFGFNPLVDLRSQQVSGYPELIAEARGLEITNLACPGEATGGFVSSNGADNHCRENRKAYPLHVAYDGTQLQAAVEYLAATPETELVTIDIGANDVFLLDHLCGRDFACILSNFVATIPKITAFLGQHEAPFIAKIYRPSTVELANDPGAPGMVSLWYDSAGPPYMQLRIRNTSSQRLYVALLSLSDTFECAVAFSDWLPARATVYVRGGRPQKLEIPAWRRSSFTVATEFVKVIAAQLEFSVTQFAMPPLLAPAEGGERAFTEESDDRSFWGTTMFRVEIQR